MKITAHIPSHWGEVTLRQYKTYFEYVKGKGSITPLEVKIRTVSVFSDLDYETILEMPLVSLNKLYEACSKLLDSPMESSMRPIIVLGSKKYGFHPHLSRASTGEWADLEQLLSNSMSAGELWPVMDQLLSVLYRPVTRIKRRVKWLKEKMTYSIEPYTSRHMENCEVFLDMDVNSVNAASVFFYDLASELGPNILTSTQNQLKKQMVMSH